MFGAEKPFQGVEITEVKPVKHKVRLRFKARETPILEPHVVGVVEVVDPDHLVAAVEQQGADAPCDEPRTAGDENPHGRPTPTWV